MEKTIAIIGGGISGLVCAGRLKQLGFKNVTVFDTGKHGPGGRCSTRHFNINGTIHLFDHSAQYFTVSDPRFAKIVSFLHKQGAVKIWNGNIGHLKHGKFIKDEKITQAFIGVDGMMSISKCLATLTNVKGQTWVSGVKWEESIQKWKLEKYGFFDYLVIAHNGKCADNLMANSGAADIHKLLQVRFNDTVNPRDNRMHLCAIWALLVAFPTSLKLPYVGAHVDDSQISWIANNTSKINKSVKDSNNSVECWTIFSTKSFAKANKVPQEHVPPAKATEVTNTLLSAFCRVIGRECLPNACFSRVQLWGAALPINILNQRGEECVFDGRHSVGICGDWLVSPCIQGAAVSGLALAEKIHKHSHGSHDLDTDLQPRFRPAASETIGAFPTNSSMIFNPK